MRYALRNQDKIEKAYSAEVLKRIIDSLNEYFKNRVTLDGIYINSLESKYPVLIINDVGHTVNMIAFYIIGAKYDVYRLAFKEFIG